MIRKILSFFLLISSVTAQAIPPDLTPRSVRNNLEEILRAHVAYQSFTSEIVERVLQNFVEEIDPTHCYFLQEEVESWIKPSETTLQAILGEMRKGDYTSFHRLYNLIEPAIHRRNVLETEIQGRALPKDVKSEEFKDSLFVSTREELLDRLLRLRSLQVGVADKLSESDRNRFIHCIEKRRLHREAELLANGPEMREKQALVFLLKAATSSLDAHTNYFTPSEASQFMIQLQQRLFGIGVQLRDDVDGFGIMRILEGGPAFQDGQLKVNDRIIAVNEEPIVGLDITEAVERIRGEKGSSLQLTVLRESGPAEARITTKLDVELIRGEVVLEESRYEVRSEPFGSGVIAHLRLFSFYQDSGSSSSLDLRKALETLKKETTIEGVVLDLRNNSGGFLPQAVAVTGLFINRGIVASIQDNSGKIQHLREIEGKPVWDGPLVVLVNRASASASEIVAQALQDYGRAIVVGDDQTFGKGTFQTFTLDAGDQAKVHPQGEFKVTRGRYFTVSGKSPQLTGVKSDLVVPGGLSLIDIGERFSKFPLVNEKIEPHFEDDLADLSLIQRIQISSLYRSGMQRQAVSHTSYLERLKQNSEARIQNNKSYSRFLQLMSQGLSDRESADLYEQDELQLSEAMNIIKDLVFLSCRNKAS